MKLHHEIYKLVKSEYNDEHLSVSDMKDITTGMFIEANKVWSGELVHKNLELINESTDFKTADEQPRVQTVKEDISVPEGKDRHNGNTASGSNWQEQPMTDKQYNYLSAAHKREVSSVMIDDYLTGVDKALGDLTKGEASEIIDIVKKNAER